jgi:hypothetical protein
MRNGLLFLTSLFLTWIHLSFGASLSDNTWVFLPIGRTPWEIMYILFHSLGFFALMKILIRAKNNKFTTHAALIALGTILGMAYSWVLWEASFNFSLGKGTFFKDPFPKFYLAWYMEPAICAGGVIMAIVTAIIISKTPKVSETPE